MIILINSNFVNGKLQQLLKCIKYYKLKNFVDTNIKFTYYIQYMINDNLS